MKREGILHKQLLNLVCSVGHGDYIMITDRGFPLPHSSYTQVIDLGLCRGNPDFTTVVGLILSELTIDCAYVAHEIKQSNPTGLLYIENKVKEPGSLCYMQHADMKQAVLDPLRYHDRTKDLTLEQSRQQGHLLQNSRIIGFIRTGECTKYSNVLLECGVAF